MMAALRANDREDGFTIIELLVITLIIAILAAISVQVFFRQRDKAYMAQTESALANARLFAESYHSGDGNGSYDDLTAEILRDEGLVTAEGVQVVVVESEPQSYCIAAINLRLPVSDPWHIGTVTSSLGRAVPGEDCIEADE